MGLNKWLDIFGYRLRLHPSGAKVAATKLLEVVEDNTEGAATVAAEVVAYFQNNATSATDLLIALLSGTAGEAGIAFGDKDGQAGKLYFDNVTGSIKLETAAGLVIEFTSAGDVKIGGGYGSTGVTISAAGALSMNGLLTPGAGNYGTWTPTVTNGTNVTGNTPRLGGYILFGPMCFFETRIDFTFTAGNTYSDAGLSLPVASNFTSGLDANVSGAGRNGASEFTHIMGVADTSNDRITLAMRPAGTAAQYHIIGGYRVL